MKSVSSEEARKMLDEAKKKPRKNKYGAVRTVVDGYAFDSQAEATDYINLKTLRSAGKIKDLTLHPKFPIYIANKLTDAMTKVCDVELDFMFFDIEKKAIRIVDRKGRDNALSKLKRKMIEAQHGIVVEVWK